MDQTSICNMALSAVGSRDTIMNINENSNEAIRCRAHWDLTRDGLLAMAWWTFARKAFPLSMTKAAPGTPEFAGTYAGVWTPDYPPPPWNYAYLLPEDCIQPRYIIPGQSANAFATPLFSIDLTVNVNVGGAPIKYIISLDRNAEGEDIKTLLTNASPAILVYTARVEDVTTWDSQFTSAFVMALGARIAYSLTGDGRLQRSLAEQALAQVQNAQLLDANQGLTVQEITPDWLSIRGVGPLDDLLPYGSVN